MIYAALTVFDWYPTKFRPEERVLKPAHFNEILSRITPVFHRCFSEKYAGISLIG